MDFKDNGLNEDNLVNLICYKADFEALLKNIQNDWRITRAMQEDEGDALLIGTRAIDQIIERLGTLEPILAQYRQAMKESEAMKENTPE